NRIDRYSAIARKNRPSASSAWLDTFSPQLGPTSETEIDLAVIPPYFARDAVMRASSARLTCVDSTRTPSLPRITILGSRTPSASTRLRTSDVETFLPDAAVSCHDVPPVKSSP